MILYNIASRGRPERLRELFENMLGGSFNRNGVYYVKVDEDDPCLPEYREYLKTIPEKYPVIVVEDIIPAGTKISAINWGIDRLLEMFPLIKRIVNVSDDQRFIVQGFDAIIESDCGPDEFIHYPDSYKKAACSTMSIMGKQYYERDHYIYNPAYYSLWCDTEATEVAKLRGCYRYVGKAIFEHWHYSNGKAQKDDTYRRNNTYKADQKVYLARRARNFDFGTPLDPFLLINYATRGRWRLFFAAVDNIYATIRTNQFKITVKADMDDVEMNNNEVIEFCKRYPNVELKFGYHKSKVEAINAEFNPLTAWKWCVTMSDDMEFVEPGWDYKMLEEIRSVWPSGWDWFAHFNDGYVGEKLPTMDIQGREFYNRFGYVYHPAYKSVSCDAENMFKAMMLGRHHYFSNIYFKHMHPTNTGDPSDYIYRRNHPAGEQDTKTYFTRLKALFEIQNPVMIPQLMKPYI